MAKKAYVGVNGISKNVKNIYVGVNGVPKKVVKGYVGVNGVAKLFWDGGGGKPESRYWYYDDDFQSLTTYTLSLEDISDTISKWLDILLGRYASLELGTYDSIICDKISERKQYYMSCMINSIPEGHNFIILRSSGNFNSGVSEIRFILYSAYMPDTTVTMRLNTSRTEIWEQQTGYSYGDYYTARYTTSIWNFNKTRCCDMWLHRDDHSTEVSETITYPADVTKVNEPFYCGMWFTDNNFGGLIYISTWMSNIGIELK